MLTFAYQPFAGGNRLFVQVDPLLLTLALFTTHAALVSQKLFLACYGIAYGAMNVQHLWDMHVRDGPFRFDTNA